MTKKELEYMAMDAHFRSTGCYYDHNHMIYMRTNENLIDLFRFYPVKNKDVLTVLASSDQLLFSYYYGAKSIDAFDKVYLTLAYYYLRKWVILYQNSLYPSISFFNEGDKNLYYLICSIQPTNTDERDAIIFWKSYLELNDYKTDKYLFYLSFFPQNNPFKCDDVKDVFQKKLHFTCANFFHDFPSSKKYDVIILSNLLEYANNSQQLIVAMNNIESLLNDDGIAVCSCLRYPKKSYNHQREVETMTSHLLKIDYNAYQYYYQPIGGYVDLAYSYQLKKK